jgi:hypothetical protein
MAIAVNQVFGKTTTTTGGATATSSSVTTVSGSLLVAISPVFNTAGALVDADCTDSKSGTWTLAQTNLGGSGAVGIGVWYQLGGTRGTTHTVSCNLTNSSNEDKLLLVVEITGHDTSTPLDTTTKATGTDATSAYTVTSAAAISGNQIAIYGVGLDTGTNTSFTAPTGYTNIGNQGNGSTDLVGGAWYKLNETGTPSPGATSSHSNTAGREVFVTFKEAASGNATATPSALSTPFTIRIPTILAGATPTPSALATNFSFPGATVKADAIAAGPRLQTPFSFPAATITAGATVTPTNLATPFSFPSPTITTGTPDVTVTPGALSTPFSFPATTVLAGATATPSNLATPFSFPAATITGTGLVTPNNLATPFSFPAPTVSGAATVTVAVLQTPFSFPAMTVTTDGSVIVSAPRLQTPFTFPGPSVSGTSPGAVTSDGIHVPFRVYRRRRRGARR